MPSSKCSKRGEGLLSSWIRLPQKGSGECAVVPMIVDAGRYRVGMWVYDLVRAAASCIHEAVQDDEYETGILFQSNMVVKLP